MILAWRFALVAAAVLVAGQITRADVVQTKTIPFTDTDWNSSTPGTQPLVFQQWDPNANPTLALKSVVVSVTMGTTNTYSMTFNAPSTISVSAIDPNTSNGVFAPTVSADKANWPLASFIPSLHVAESGQLTKTVTENPGAAFPITLNSAQLGGPVTFSSTFTPSTPIVSSNPDFAKFEGTGTIAFPFLAEGTSRFMSSGGNGVGSVHTQANVSMTVQYVTGLKTVAPEPASVLLLGLGAAGLLVARQWRARQQAQSDDAA